MSFDDLAKHMAKRDGKKKLPMGDAAQIMADAAKADARMTRQRNLILGPILLIGGAVILTLGALNVREVLHLIAAKTPTIGSRNMLLLVGVPAVALVMFVAGAIQTWRGLRNKPADDIDALARNPLDQIHTPSFRSGE